MHLTSQDAKIYVAGHRGMVGRALWQRLRAAGYRNLVGRTSAELDLRDPRATRSFYEAEWPDVVVLAAARVGGILANDQYPADFLGDNLAIEQSVIQAATRRASSASSSSAPRASTPSTPRSRCRRNTSDRPPRAHERVVRHRQDRRRQALPGLSPPARRRLHQPMPTNLYGLGDNFDLKTSHVLPALLRKFHEAKRPAGEDDAPSRCGARARRAANSSGPTTSPTRASSCWSSPKPPARGGPRRHLQRRLRGRPRHRRAGRDDPGGGRPRRARSSTTRSKPDGTPRKLLDVSRMEALGWAGPDAACARASSRRMTGTAPTSRGRRRLGCRRRSNLKR